MLSVETRLVYSIIPTFDSKVSKGSSERVCDSKEEIHSSPAPARALVGVVQSPVIISKRKMIDTCQDIYKDL